MRKQILAGLMAAVALLFSVVALTTSPASSSDYASYASTKGGTATCMINGNVISGTTTGMPGGSPVSVSSANGYTISSQTMADGTFSITIPAGPSGAMTATIGGDIVVDCGTYTPGTPVPTTVVVNPTAVANPTPAPTTGVPVVVDYGFTNGIPTQPALAVTGSETDILGFIATGLIALGAVAMGSRRKLLQGALED